MRSAIDAGFRWSDAHKEEREEVLAEFPRRFAGGINSWGYGKHVPVPRAVVDPQSN
jgi:predicted Fe-S protein YdhL (DUF1289 family)